MRIRVVAAAVWLWIVPALCVAAGPAAIHGVTTAQRGEILLPGVEITVTHVGTGRQAGVVVSDGLGQFSVEGLEPGRYEIVARLEGFADRKSGPITLVENQDAAVNLDLDLASVTETVKVVAEAGLAQARTSGARDTVSGQMVDILPVVGDSYRALLPVLPGVVRQPDGRISVKGARPTQGALQLGRGSGTDPSSGNFALELPPDAVESVDMVSSPYGAEDGRLSSSLVQIETRSGNNVWRAVANGVVPALCLKLCDGATVGITTYQPRGWVGGPLIKDRLFFAQGAQYRWNRTRVPSLPKDANYIVSESLYSFTRFDATLTSGHTATATLAVFPRSIDAANLNTFNSVEVAPNLRLFGWNVALIDRLSLWRASFLESNLNISLYHTRVSGDDELGDMQLTTEGNRGTFFNTQSRRTSAFQWTESLQMLRHAAGEHLIKIGFDVMNAKYTGTSQSRPVLVVRADGTVSQRYEFGGETSQRVSGVDVAAFLQDRWRLTPRVALEPGLRFDRDGALGRYSISPRFGFVAAILPRDIAVLKGGAGLFFERTPLNVGAFESFEAATLTRYAADGATPAGPRLTFVHRTGLLETPRAFTWNLEYNHRFGSSVLVRLNHVQRRESRDALVTPRESGGLAQLSLDSTGRSRYTETELTVRFGTNDTRQLTLSYVRSHQTANLNAYDHFYGDFRTPIVRPDQYATGPTDVPNRFVARGVVTVREKWTLSSVVEIRDGFPYSIINQDQEYVGVRNAGGRFPTLATCDASVSRSGTIRRYPVRFGLRLYHIFNTFAPRDVQNNMDSPAFGAFYNGIVRKISLNFQISLK